MSDPTRSDETTISRDRVLWRTRGRHWDYRFLLRPGLAGVHNWYDVHQQVFDGLIPDADGQHRAGPVSGTAEVSTYVAVAFTDARRRDQAGRPVCHYLAWFRSGQPSDMAPVEVPEQWGSQLVEAFGAALDAVFDLAPPDTPHSDSIAAAMAAMPETLCPGGPSRWVVPDRPLELKKNCPPTPLRGTVRRAALLWLLLVAVAAVLWVVFRREAPARHPEARRAAPRQVRWSPDVAGRIPR